jgi:hypothetical protein
MNKLTRSAVYDAINKERDFQDAKWGKDKPLSLPGFIIALRSELEEVELGWLKNLPGKSAPLNELVQVAALAVAALERYGVTGNTVSQDDICEGAE